MGMLSLGSFLLGTQRIRTTHSLEDIPLLIWMASLLSCSPQPPFLFASSSTSTPIQPSPKGKLSQPKTQALAILAPRLARKHSRVSLLPAGFDLHRYAPHPHVSYSPSSSPAFPSEARLSALPASLSTARPGPSAP